MRHALVALCLSLVALSLPAATFDLPSDRQLLDRAHVVVIATVLDAQSHQTADRGIFTDYRLAVEDVLKGMTSNAVITVREEGGSANGILLVIPGAVSYEPGSRVVTFLRQRPDGSYFTAYMGLGKYRFRHVDNEDVLVRDPNGIEITDGEAFDVRPAKQFVEYVREGAPPSSRPRVHADAARVLEPVANANADSYTLAGGNPERPLRWPCTSGANCSFGFHLGGGAQPGVTDTVGGVEDALATWSLNPNSFISLSIAGLSGASSISAPDGQNTILLNASSSPGLGSCDSASACGKVWANDEAPTHNWDGSTFYTVFEGDVQIGTTSMSQSTFVAFMVHELGHAIALRHSNQGTPATSASVMNSTLTGSQLFDWDLDAMAEVYGTGAPCTPISINSVSGGGTVPFGQSAALSVVASGDAPRTYQWYEGATGNTTTPVGTNSPNFVTPAITETRQYWVKVTNGCPSSANSTTITVSPEACDAPLISTQSQSLRINPNTFTTLGVTASGTGPLIYRWYRSNTVGDTSVQVGTTAGFTTPMLSTTTSYWARVSNACGHADTSLITVTVSAACVPASISAQSSSTNLLLGDGATISVTPAGDSPFTYQWFEGASPDVTTPIAGATNHSYAAGPFTTPGNRSYWAKVTNECGSANSATITLSVACPEIVRPLVSAPAISHFSNGYHVFWTGDVGVTPTFELQEATNAEFTQNLQTFTVTGALSKAITPHLEVPQDTRFYYRVRAFSICTGLPTSYSNTTSTVVTRPLPATSDQFLFSVPDGTSNTFTQDLLVPGFGETATSGDTFSIVIDVPWMTVFPTTGALSAGGTTVQLTVNPAGLEVGTTTGTIKLTRTNGSAANGIATHGTASSSNSIPLSIALVTPVSPDPRGGNPPPGTLIVPAVAHAQGVGSPFRSDVRIVNVSFSDIDYEIGYTPSQTDGTQIGKKTTVTIRAGDVLALDDIVASWFGAGMLGEGGIGTIEIRPLTSDNPLDTFASSRTYALDGVGTLGQFIPALRVNEFIGNITQDSLARISLQQLANSADYRTNIGFVEGTGNPASFLARLVDGNNNLIQSANLQLSAFGHLQRPLTNLFGNVNLNDGRVEVEVTSAAGKVSAYASVLNNTTNDPLMVFPAQPARTTAERYVVAGVAEFSAASNFHSHMRIYNAGPTAVTATLNYYEQNSTTPRDGAAPVNITLNPGQVRAIDNVLPTLWPGLVGGGSVIATTPGPSSLVLTAQTFSLQPDGGTKGQFIPGVTFREGTGLGERPLEVLQLEQSDQYRSNVGFVEVTGKSVKLEVTAHKPDAKTSTITHIDLGPNQYVQYARFLSQMGLGTVYNGRVSVKVIEGEGRVYAYGSTVDNRTEDPTYVPAQ